MSVETQGDWDLKSRWERPAPSGLRERKLAIETDWETGTELAEPSSQI